MRDRPASPRELPALGRALTRLRRAKIVRYCTPPVAQRRTYSVTAYMDHDEWIRFKKLADQTGQGQSKTARDLIVAGLPVKETRP